MDFAQIFVDGFMVLTGCTGVLCCTYGVSCWVKGRSVTSWFGNSARRPEVPSIGVITACNQPESLIS
jgi:hypothetical protein